MLNVARRAFHATRRQLSSDALSSGAIPKPPTAALAKRSQLLRDVRSQRPFLDEILPRRRRLDVRRHLDADAGHDFTPKRTLGTDVAEELAAFR